MIKKLAIATIALSAFSLSGCSAPEPEPTKLVFAGAPLTPPVDGQPNSYQVMLDLITEETGLPVEYHESTDRGAIVEGLVSGQIDFAAIDPYGYVLATAIDQEIKLAASQSRGPDIEPGFTSLAIARADDSSINTLDDVAGKKICFSDPASTAGFLYPAKGLKASGLEVNAAGQGDFDSEFTGVVPYQPAINVFKGACDVGFIPDSMWFGVLKTIKEIDLSKLKVVWESEKIPSPVIVVGSHISSNLQNKLSEILTTKANKTYFVENGICASETDCNFLNVANWGYTLLDNNAYEPVRETCVALGIKQCEIN